MFASVSVRIDAKMNDSVKNGAPGKPSDVAICVDGAFFALGLGLLIQTKLDKDYWSFRWLGRKRFASATC